MYLLLKTVACSATSREGTVAVPRQLVPLNPQEKVDLQMLLS